MTGDYVLTEKPPIIPTTGCQYSVYDQSVNIHCGIASGITSCCGYILLYSSCSSDVFVSRPIHRESKKGDTILLSISLLNIDRFSQFFHRRTQLEIFAIKLLIKIPPHLRCVATLPCEMFQQDSAPAHARQSSCCNGRRPHSSHLICGFRIAQISTQ